MRYIYGDLQPLPFLSRRRDLEVFPYVGTIVPPQSEPSERNLKIGCLNTLLFRRNKIGVLNTIQQCRHHPLIMLYEEFEGG